MHRYTISTGRWQFPDGGTATGYSGFDPDPSVKGEPGEGKNDPSDVGVKNVGPIPPGRYKIGLPHLNTVGGPYTMRLHPQPGNAMYGRGSFLIHGDSLTEPGKASHGCVILQRAYRLRIGESGDEDLEVVA